MRFRTEMYSVTSNKCFGIVTKAEWKLWFIEVLDVPDRQEIIECITLPVKPTKRQIRKLRRQFRKSLVVWNYGDKGYAGKVHNPDFVTIIDNGLYYGYFKTSKEK